MPAWCLILQPKSTVRNAVIPATVTGIPDAAAIGGILRRATPPELIGTYKYNSMVLYLFGYKTGKAGTENKHEMPPPHDKVLLFGEAVLFACKDAVPISFGTAEWPKFYETGMGGFEDLDDDEEDDEEEEEEEEDEEEEELLQAQVAMQKVHASRRNTVVEVFLILGIFVGIGLWAMKTS